jgi:hypothetical protein
MKVGLGLIWLRTESNAVYVIMIMNKICGLHGSEYSS